MSKPSQPPIHQRIRAAMTLQRTAALTAFFCVILAFLGAFFSPTEDQLSSALLGLTLTVVTTCAYRWPINMSVAFVVIWVAATLLTKTPFISSVFLAPIFLAVIAYHGHHGRTFLIGMVLWLGGLSLIHISEPTRHFKRSRMPSSA